MREEEGKRIWRRKGRWKKTKHIYIERGGRVETKERHKIYKKILSDNEEKTEERIKIERCQICDVLKFFKER